MRTVTPAQHRRAIWMLLLANLLWGVSFPVIKSLALLQAQLVPGSSTWFITACTLLPRFTLGAVLLGAGCAGALRTLTRSEWRQSLGLGVFAFVGMMLQNDGLQYVAASTSAFLTQLYAILIPVYLALRARRHPPWTVWAGCLLVLAGVAVLARLNWHDLRLGRGELETLVASVFFMGQILWLERPEFTGNRMLPVTAVMFAIEAAGAAAMLPLAPAGADFGRLVASGPWLGLTAILTGLCTLGSFTLMNLFQPRITATEAGLLYCSEPVFTSIMVLFLPAWFAAWGGLVYANETLGANLLLGGGLILAANVVVQLGVARLKAQAA